MRLFDKIEEGAVIVHFDDTPAAGKGLGKSQAPWPSAGLRDQVGPPHQGGGSEGKSLCDAITPRKLVFSCLQSS